MYEIKYDMLVKFNIAKHKYEIPNGKLRDKFLNGTSCDNTDILSFYRYLSDVACVDILGVSEVKQLTESERLALIVEKRRKKEAGVQG